MWQCFEELQLHNLHLQKQEQKPEQIIILATITLRLQKQCPTSSWRASGSWATVMPPVLYCRQGEFFLRKHTELIRNICLSRSSRTHTHICTDPDAETSESPIGAYQRIPPGQIIPSPVVQLPLHSSHNTIHNSQRSNESVVKVIADPRLLHPLHNSQRSSNGLNIAATQRASSGEIPERDMEIDTLKGMGIKRALRMLLMTAQQVWSAKWTLLEYWCVLLCVNTHLMCVCAHMFQQPSVPKDSDCPQVMEDDASKSYNMIISELFREVKRLKQQV